MSELTREAVVKYFEEITEKHGISMDDLNVMFDAGDIVIQKHSYGFSGDTFTELERISHEQ